MKKRRLISMAVAMVVLGSGALYAGNEGDANDNTYYGTDSAASLTTGSDNVMVGVNAGYNLSTGEGNVIVGKDSGRQVGEGNHNTLIGYGTAGRNAEHTMEGNVFIGYNVGRYATGQNLLMIDNSSTSYPLLFGKFDTQVNGRNGKLTVNGTLESYRKFTADEGINSLGAVNVGMTGSFTTQATRALTLAVNNTNTEKKSDVSFVMANGREGFGWIFRTFEKNQGFTINKLKQNPVHPGRKDFLLYETATDDANSVVLKLGNGAWCDGVWHNTSSRTMKKDIKPLPAEAAMKAFDKLQPVTYAYKSNPSDPKVGFIAEDVPELVADPGHKSLSSMDMVALLTKVVQVQQKQIKEMETKVSKMEQMQKRLSSLENLLSNLALKAEKSGKAVAAK